MKIESLPYSIENDFLHLGTRTKKVKVTFHRTLRIPDSDSSFPLPPSLGHFPLRRAKDYLHSVPQKWIEEDAIFFPIFQREAMWLGFDADCESVLKVGIGKVNAVTGKEWTYNLDSKVQDYIPVPGQPWIDGINDGSGHIKQFVAMPMGSGYTVEKQVTGKEDVGGMQLVMMNAKNVDEQRALKARRTKDLLKEPQKHDAEHLFVSSSLMSSYDEDDESECCMEDACDISQISPKVKASSRTRKTMKKKSKKVAELGLAAGGKMIQKIYTDIHGVEYWDDTKICSVFVHLVSPEVFRGITGESVSTQVDEDAYKKNKYPWFKLYDEHKKTVKQSEILSNVKSVKQVDVEKGIAETMDEAPQVMEIHSIKGKK